jgi:hypothetical protein
MVERVDGLTVPYIIYVYMQTFKVRTRFVADTSGLPIRFVSDTFCPQYISSPIRFVADTFYRQYILDLYILSRYIFPCTVPSCTDQSQFLL